MEQEKLIGRKVKGFKFEPLKIGYNHFMDKFIGEVGIIKEFSSDNKSCIIEFDSNNSYYYPADQIEAHLVDNEIPTLSDGVMMLVKDGFREEWEERKVFGKKNGLFYAWGVFNEKTVISWKYAKPLEPTKEEQLTAILGSSDKVSEIMELFKK